VKLKGKRERAIDDVISDVRGKINNRNLPLTSNSFRFFQDMIGDLTNAPEPIQIKLFAQDEKVLEGSAPKVADAIQKIPGVVDVLNGIDNTISGPAAVFQVDPVCCACWIHRGRSRDRCGSDP